jgi:hypothetical protein
MNFLHNDTNAAISAIELPKPKIEAHLSYGGDYIFFRMNNNIAFNEEKIKTINELALSAVKACTNVKLDAEKNIYYINTNLDSAYENIKYNMRSHIVDFIVFKGGHANNRLTSLYKWYKNATCNNIFLRNESFMSDLYEFTKFSIAGSQNNEEHLKVCRTLLALIKNRYEYLENQHNSTKRKKTI